MGINAGAGGRSRGTARKHPDRLLLRVMLLLLLLGRGGCTEALAGS